MQNNITADSIATRVRLLRTQHKGAFLIVEGSDDALLYGHLVDHQHCTIVPAYGRDNALAALQILERDGFEGVLVIADADFDVIKGELPATPNQLLTDTHDGETMLLASPALDKVLREHGSTQKLQGRDVRELLLETGIPLGFLRYISLRDTLSLDFEGLTFSHFVDRQTLALDRDKMVTAIKNNSRLFGLDQQALLQNMAALYDAGYDPWQVCCGHDLIDLLSLGLQRVLGTNDANQVAPRAIAKALRMSYEAPFFQVTTLYASIRDWEGRNAPYKVLP